jgi:small-conductance mechanosensitive channel
VSDHVQPIALLGGAAIGGLLIGWLAFAVLRHLSRARGGEVMKVLVRRSRNPVYLLLATLAVMLVLPGAHVAAGVSDPLQHAVGLAAIAAIGWAAVAATYIAEQAVLARYDVTVPDNAAARRVITQTTVLRRVITFVIVVVVASAMLMTFGRARALGASLLASAGIVGIVVGFAARPTLGNIIAGLQIALTNSLIIQDAVIVEGEWGRIEEITLTYVVVRIWDDRRLILPSVYFVTTPFQNWTRGGEDLIGAVMLNVDYAVPVDAIRKALDGIVKDCPDWDGRVCGVQVVDAGERSMQLRVLVSGRTSGATWNVRCVVREGLIGFLRDSYPSALPRSRVELADGWPGLHPAPAAG